MEKDGKEQENSKHRSYFVMKALLLVLCVVAVAQFILFANNFASLKALNNKLNAMEAKKTLVFKSLRSGKHEHGRRRSKRNIDEMEFKKAMVKLEKLEGR